MRAKQLLIHHRGDLLLILLPLLLAAALWVFLRLHSAAGAVVTVRVDGVTVARLPLNRDDSFYWEGEQGGNLLLIENGAAYMASADCPDHLCVRQGAIRRSGESIVCLPHRLVATVTAEAEAEAPDAVSR